MDISALSKNGYMVVQNVVPTTFIKKALARTETLVAKNPDIPPDVINQFRMDFDETDYSLLADKSLVKLASAFLGPNIASPWMRYFMCQPYTGRAVPWHQDGAGQLLEPLEYLYFWVALDNVTKRSGLIHVIPNSHDNPILPRQELPPTPYQVMTQALDPSVVETLGEPSEIRMSAGDVLVAHPNLVISCQPNQSNSWRRGLSARYMAPSTKIVWTDAYNEPWSRAFLLAGKDDGTNKYSSPPKTVPLPAMVTNSSPAFRLRSVGMHCLP